MKYFYHKNFLLFLLLLFLFLFLLWISISSYSTAIVNDISNQILRLHVIANSDLPEDQNIKLHVRDAILQYMKGNSEIHTKEDALSFVNTNHQTLTDIANNILSEYHCNYTATVSVEHTKFPTKIYANTSFPAGDYDALKIQLGQAKRSKLVVRCLSSPLFCKCF